MQHLCIAALLLSAVAAQLDAEPKLGDSKKPVTEAQEHGSDWDAGHPWLLEMPPWFPNQQARRPGNPRRPVEGTDGRPSQRGPDFKPGERGVPPPGRLRGPSGDRRPNRRPMELSPVFKVDGVTFQSTSAVPLQEGETMFRMVRPREGEEGPRPEEKRRGERRGPGQYVKLIYKAMEPNKVSIEFGVMKPVKPGELVRGEDIFEDDY
ncbi:uncharacterized protein LOC117255892 isoform X1 [Epinephelus lanceolatus]